MFAKHHFNVGKNKERKIKLTPEHPLPVYFLGPHAPINPRGGILTELALLQHFYIVTTLSLSQYSRPKFVHRKSSGELRKPLELRRAIHHLRHDFTKSNYPISIMTDASNHCAGRNLLCKIDCLQAYHCVQLADDLLVQI